MTQKTMALEVSRLSVPRVHGGESGIAVRFKPYLASDTNLHTRFDMITVPCYNMDTPELATCNSHINEM